MILLLVNGGINTSIVFYKIPFLRELGQQDPVPFLQSEVNSH